MRMTGSTRQLLRAGERQQLTFKSDRLTVCNLQIGMAVMVLGINKRPDRQINYGTGGAVNEESVDDGRIPMKLRWYSDSYIDLSIHRARLDKEPRLGQNRRCVIERAPARRMSAPCIRYGCSFQPKRLGAGTVAVVDLELYAVGGRSGWDVDAATTAHTHQLVLAIPHRDRRPLLVGSAAVGPELNQAAVRRSLVGDVEDLAGRGAFRDAVVAVAHRL